MFSDSSQMLSNQTYTVYYGFDSQNNHTITLLSKSNAEFALNKGTIKRWESREVSEIEYLRLVDQTVSNPQTY